MGWWPFPPRRKDDPEAGFLPRMIKAAREADDAMAYGRALGLDAATAREVLGAWIEFNMQAGLPWNAGNVRRSMERRRDGRPWDPRDDRYVLIRP